MKLWWRNTPGPDGFYIRAWRDRTGDWEYERVRIEHDEGDIVCEDLERGGSWTVYEDGSKWLGPIDPPKVSTETEEVPV